MNESNQFLIEINNSTTEIKKEKTIFLNNKFLNQEIIDKNKKELEKHTKKKKINYFKKLHKSNSINQIKNKNINNILPNFFSSLALTQFITLKFFKNIHKDFFTYGDEVNINLVKALRIKPYHNKEIIYLNKEKEKNNIFIILSGEINAYKTNKYNPDFLIKGDSILSKYYEKIINLSNTQIGEISYDEYKSIYNKYKTLDLINEKDYFCNLELFKPFNDSGRIFLICEKIFYKKGDIITKQGEKMTNFYIIRKGSFQVKYSLVNNIEKELNFDAIDAIIKSPYEGFSSVRRYELLDSYNQESYYKVFILSEGDYIGDFELYKNSDNYFFTIICDIDESILYKIPEEQLYMIKNNNFHNILTQVIQPKITLFEDRINSIVSNSTRTDSIKNKFVKIINHKILHSPILNKDILYEVKNHHILINKKSKIKIPKNLSNSLNNIKYKNEYEERLAENLRMPNYKKGIFDKVFYFKKSKSSRNNIKKQFLLTSLNFKNKQNNIKNISLIKENKPNNNSLTKIQDYLTFNENKKKTTKNKLYNSLENKINFYINNNSIEMNKILSKIFQKNKKKNVFLYYKK